MNDGAARFAARYPIVWHVIEADGAGDWLPETGLMPTADLLRIAGLTVSRLDLEATDAKFDLSLEVHDWEGRLDGALSYRSDLFDAATIDRMAGHLSMLLAGAAAAPETRLSELSLLTAAEQAQLAAWNAPHPPTPSPIPSLPPGEGEKSLHRLITAQAARTPFSCLGRWSVCKGFAFTSAISAALYFL